MEIITVHQNKTPTKTYYQLCYMDQNAGGCRQKTTQTNCQLFHTKSLRRILRMFWPNKISNEDLLRQCNQESMAKNLNRRRWKWIGHVVIRDQNYVITKTALHWTPEGKRKRGRPNNTYGDVQ